MAGAPQEYTQGLFYVPIDGQAPNAAAAFIATMTQQRVRQAEDMLARRLAALDPSARNAQLAELAKVRADLVGQLASSERSRIDASAKTTVAKASNFDELVRLAQTEATVSGGLSEAAMNLEAEEHRARALKEGGQNVLTDVQGALQTAGRRLRDAYLLPAGSAERKAAADQVYRDLVPRLGAASRAAGQLPSQGEQDAVADRINEFAATTDIGDPAELERFRKAVGTAFSRPGTIAPTRRGFVRADPEDIARQTVRVGDILGEPTGAVTGGSAGATVGVGSSSRRPASSVAPERAGSELSSAGGAPNAGGADEDIREQLKALDALEDQIRSYDPRKALGGLYDPYPGARPERPEVNAEMVRRLQDEKPDRFARATGARPLPTPKRKADGELGTLEEETAFELMPDLFGPIRRRATPPELRATTGRKVGLEGPEEPPPTAPKKTGGQKALERLETTKTPSKSPPPGGGAGDVKLREQEQLDALFGKPKPSPPPGPKGAGDVKLREEQMLREELFRLQDLGFGDEDEDKKK